MKVAFKVGSVGLVEQSGLDVGLIPPVVNDTELAPPTAPWIILTENGLLTILQ